METYAGARFEGKIETFDPCVIQVMSQSQTTGSNQRLNESADSQQNQQVSQIHQEDQEQQSCQMTNMQPNTTLTPVKLPAILDGEFFSVVRLEGTNITVRCLSCDKLLNGNLKSTGNFLSHIKVRNCFLLIVPELLNMVNDILISSWGVHSVYRVTHVKDYTYKPSKK